jgi:tetratricopeptide (TPR) repeat protein
MNPIIASSILFIGAAMFGETSPREISSTEAEKHLVQRAEPEISPMEMLLGRDCKVKLHVVIAPSGSVSSADLFKGDSIFNGAAIEAVRKWKYDPFMENGIPSEANTEVELAIPCGMPEQEKAVRKKYFPMVNECRDLLRSGNYPDGEKKCREAVEISNELPKDVILERSSARSLLAHSILNQGRIKESIPIYEEALTLDKGFRESNDADLATDYANLGRAHALLGELASADELFAISISTFEAAILNLPELKENYTMRLRAGLNEYAQIKELRGQKEEAEKLRKKAAGLK